MEIIDLSYPISSNMPVYPGDKLPEFNLQASIGKDGYQVSRISLDSHTGTHIDAGAHLVPEGRSLQDYSLPDFIGKGIYFLLRAFAFACIRWFPGAGNGDHKRIIHAWIC